MLFLCDNGWLSITRRARWPSCSTPDPPAWLPPHPLQPLHSGRVASDQSRAQVSEVSKLNIWISISWRSSWSTFTKFLHRLLQRFYTINGRQCDEQKLSSLCDSSQQPADRSQQDEMIFIIIFSLTPTPAKKHLHGLRPQRWERKIIRLKSTNHKICYQTKNFLYPTVNIGHTFLLYWYSLKPLTIYFIWSGCRVPQCQWGDPCQYLILSEEISCILWSLGINEIFLIIIRLFFL